MDGLKEIFAAFESRVRSKVVGSVLLAFIATNWKAIFYLIFARKTVEDKFEYFDLNTSYLTLFIIPVVAGTVLALLLPWINAYGIKYTASPDRMQRDLKSDSRHKDDIKSLEYATKIQELKARQQQAIVKSAKADEEAKSISDPKARKETIQNIDNLAEDIKLLQDTSSIDSQKNLPRLELISRRESPEINSLEEFKEIIDEVIEAISIVESKGQKIMAEIRDTEEKKHSSLEAYENALKSLRKSGDQKAIIDLKIKRAQEIKDSEKLESDLKLLINTLRNQHDDLFSHKSSLMDAFEKQYNL